ncbi:MAG TPA: chemotaxis protein CheW [Gemmatimonadaceae bacterium]|nr:chemotaxis protein CheW [Gemmatimonadaceae bacterium]
MASSAPTISAPTTPAAPAAPASIGERILLFGLSGHVHGCALTAVREIVPLRPATRLPGAPNYVLGLVNLRGTIVTVIDLGRRLLHGGRVRGDGSVILVEAGAKVVGVAVDEVRDVQTIPPEAIDPVGAGTEGGVVRGLVHLDGQVVVLLDMQTLVRQVLL